MPAPRSDAAKGEEVGPGTYRNRRERRTAFEFNNSFDDLLFEVVREKSPTTFVFLRVKGINEELWSRYALSAVQAKTLGEELVAYAEAARA